MLEVIVVAVGSLIIGLAGGAILGVMYGKSEIAYLQERVDNFVAAARAEEQAFIARGGAAMKAAESLPQQVNAQIQQEAEKAAKNL